MSNPQHVYDKLESDLLNKIGIKNLNSLNQIFEYLYKKPRLHIKMRKALSI